MGSREDMARKHLFAFDDADIASLTAMIYYGVEHYFNGLYGHTNDDDVNAMDETLSNRSLSMRNTERHRTRMIASARY